MRIQSLLNPFDCREHHGPRDSESPTPATMARTVGPCTSAPKRQKLPKDAAIFADDAKVNGPVNFPPYEAGDDEELLAQHRRFQVYPMGNIQKKGARRIPYNSDKKDFMPKTGRDAFEVFQYEFKVPGDEKTYNVLWDYQVGLVRITPFFKCCKYSKTTPAKVLNLNQGLREISYSITGGALAAQGYWMPYEAAKAVAATFCYNIRYALTPIFGKEFPSMCIPPHEPSYAKFLIDPAIVRECTEETNRWRTEGVPQQRNIPSTPETPSTPITPEMKFSCPPWTARKQHPPQSADQESGYGTDEDPNEKCLFSPDVSPRSHAWTSINRRSRSPVSRSPYVPYQNSRWAGKTAKDACNEQLNAKRTLSKVGSDTEEEEQFEFPTRATVDSNEVAGWGDIEVAETLLILSAADSNLHRPKRTRRRSDSNEAE